MLSSMKSSKKGASVKEIEAKVRQSIEEQEDQESRYDTMVRSEYRDLLQSDEGRDLTFDAWETALEAWLTREGVPVTDENIDDLYQRILRNDISSLSEKTRDGIADTKRRLKRFGKHKKLLDLVIDKTRDDLPTASKLERPDGYDKLVKAKREESDKSQKYLDYVAKDEKELYDFVSSTYPSWPEDKAAKWVREHREYSAEEVKLAQSLQKQNPKITRGMDYWKSAARTQMLAHHNPIVKGNRVFLEKAERLYSGEWIDKGKQDLYGPLEPLEKSVEPVTRVRRKGVTGVGSGISMASAERDLADESPEMQSAATVTRSRGKQVGTGDPTRRERSGKKGLPPPPPSPDRDI